jgi:diguanylate cyclase (GGDEF)-like protein
MVDDSTYKSPQHASSAGGIAAAREGRRTGARAGLVRVALASLGLATSLFAPELTSRWAFTAYLTLAVLFQWAILRRWARTVTRAVVMGLVDTLFLSYCVHRIGSTSSLLPLVYVVIPVLYATTTPRRRVSMIIAHCGVVSYAIVVLLEQLAVLPYAPASGLPRPDAAMGISSVLLLAICTSVTAGLTSQLISALGKANMRLRDLSQHDELTGLYNRRYVMLRLDDELARIRRSPGVVTAAMVDLDGFKRVNDEEGHDAGDAVLKAVASALLMAKRRADVVARYGGDEFLVLLPNTDKEGARVVSARMLDLARDAARRVCPAIPVSASIGATMMRATDDPADLIRRVDEQLYAAKHAGGDRVVTD